MQHSYYYLFSWRKPSIVYSPTIALTKVNKENDCNYLGVVINVNDKLIRTDSYAIEFAILFHDL